jgi:hypothetical protein
MSQLRTLLAFGFVVWLLAAIGTPAAASEASADPPTQADLVQAAAFRTSLALRSDPAYIELSFDDRVAFPDRQWGVPLTSLEAEDVGRRVDAQGAIGKVADWADSNVPDYAGTWIDHTRHGLAVVLLKGDSADARASIAAQVPAGIEFEITPAERSWTELVSTKAKILGEWDSLIKKGIPLVSTAIDTPTNTVLVGLERRSSEIEGGLLATFGSGLSFREDSPAHADSCPWTQCLPAKGGIRMVSQQVGNVCTTGFLAKVTSVSPNYRVVVTAGHCFRAGGGSGIGDDWRHYQGTTMTKFGDAERETWFDNSGADVGLIKLTSTPPDGNAFVGFEDSNGFQIRQLISRASNASQVVGDLVCRMGGNLQSGYVCGAIIHVAVDRESPISGIGSMTILNQNEARFDSLSGDSGGSVYSAQTAYGTHTHSTDPGDFDHPRSWFTPIGRGESQYLTTRGVTYRLCFNDACTLTD